MAWRIKSVKLPGEMIQTFAFTRKVSLVNVWEISEYQYMCERVLSIFTPCAFLDGAASGDFFSVFIVTVYIANLLSGRLKTPPPKSESHKKYDLGYNSSIQCPRQRDKKLPIENSFHIPLLIGEMYLDFLKI